MAMKSGSASVLTGSSSAASITGRGIGGGGVKILGTISGGIGKEGRIGPPIAAGSKWAQPDRSFAASVKSIAARGPARFGEIYKPGMKVAEPQVPKVGLINSGENRIKSLGRNSDGGIKTPVSVETQIGRIFGDKMTAPTVQEADRRISWSGSGKDSAVREVNITAGGVSKELTGEGKTLGSHLSDVVRIDSRSGLVREMMTVGLRNESADRTDRNFRIDKTRINPAGNIDTRLLRAAIRTPENTEKVSDKVITKRGRLRFDPVLTRGGSAGLNEIFRRSAVYSQPIKGIEVSGKKYPDGKAILNIDTNLPAELNSSGIAVGIRNRDLGSLPAGENSEVLTKREAVQVLTGAGQNSENGSGQEDVYRLFKDIQPDLNAIKIQNIRGRLDTLDPESKKKAVDKIRAGKSGQSIEDSIAAAVESVKREAGVREIFRSIDLIVAGKSIGAKENGNPSFALQTAEISAAVKTIEAFQAAGTPGKEISSRLQKVLTEKGVVPEEQAELLTGQLIAGVAKVRSEMETPETKQLVFIEAGKEQQARVDVIETSLGKIEPDEEGFLNGRDLAMFLPNEADLPEIISPIAKQKLSDGSWREIRQETAVLGKLKPDELVARMNRLVTEKPAVEIDEQIRTRAVGHEDVMRVLRTNVENFIRSVLYPGIPYRSVQAA